MDDRVSGLVAYSRMYNIPWVPLFTIERSGQPEVMVSGIVSVVANGDKSADIKDVLSVGDVDYHLWSRSVLKPWQLLSNLVPLQGAYPKLGDRHFALITASHSAEPEHLCVLNELLAIGRLKEDMLQCPAAMPLSAEYRFKLRQEGIKPKALFNNCSGKHLGYLLGLQAQSLPLETYLNPEGKQFVPLKQALGTLLGRPPSSFKFTTDGCRLPNYDLSIKEMARLYMTLVVEPDTNWLKAVPQEVKDMFACYDLLGKTFRAYPQLIGGTGRVDTNIMEGKLGNLSFARGMVAKQGAEGLIAIGVPPNKKYPNGVGILIKLASGFVEKYMEVMTVEIFKQLGVEMDRSGKSDDPALSHITTKFHFQIT